MIYLVGDFYLIVKRILKLFQNKKSEIWSPGISGYTVFYSIHLLYSRYNYATPQYATPEYTTLEYITLHYIVYYYYTNDILLYI